MLLSEQQIKNIILNNPKKSLIQKGKLYNKEMRKHFYGENLEAELQTIDGFEKESLRTLRVKYAKSNKDLFSRLSRPIDNVFSARGGSLYFNLAETEERKARALAADICGGYSVSKWIENVWKAHYLDDPFGIIFMEIATEKEYQILKMKGKSYVYPTYKSIQSIYDYEPNGTGLEYVVFNVSNSEKVQNGFKPEDKIFRVVDDGFDYWVKQDAETVQILLNKSYPNLFMKVPGIINSDIPDPAMSCGYLSLFDEITELANTFLMKGSIKLTHEFFFAFPKYWEYADDCKTCKGSGFLKSELCPDCKGTKKSIMSKVSDVKMIAWPSDKETPVVTPNVAGFVSPDKTYYEISTNDLALLEKVMFDTIWGTQSVQQVPGMQTTTAGPKTATEITTEFKPKSDRLEPISESAQIRHKFILDSIISIQVNQNYPGSSVNYGRRYMIEDADSLFKKYNDAKSAGVAYSVLDDMLLKYYETEYKTDHIKFSIQSKLMKVEPFVHYKISDVQKFGVTDIDVYKKTYYGEWISTLNDAMILSFSVETLNEMLTLYATEKLINKPKPEPAFSASGAN